MWGSPYSVSFSLTKLDKVINAIEAQLYMLRKNSTLIVRWHTLPGHTSRPGNEKADTQARAGAECTMIRLSRDTIRAYLRSKDQACGNLSPIKVATTSRGLSTQWSWVEPSVEPHRRPKQTKNRGNDILRFCNLEHETLENYISGTSKHLFGAY